MLYRKKPVTVAAEQFLFSEKKDLQELIKYCKKLRVKIDLDGSKYSTLKFSFNDFPIFEGSWIVRDGSKFFVFSDSDFKNNFVVCSDDSTAEFEDVTSGEDCLQEKELDDILPTV